MDEPAAQETITPENEQPQTEAASGEVPQSAPVDAIPPENTWLLYYNGEKALTKAEFTWQPEDALRVPESVARTLIGSDNLRKVDDEELFYALRAKVEILPDDEPATPGA